MGWRSRAGGPKDPGPSRATRRRWSARPGPEEVRAVSSAEHEVLAQAARDALRAPSMHNSQPWRWRVDAGALELSADAGRQLKVADPHARLMMVSCGAALHHARVSVAAAGWDPAVRRYPAGAGGLARLVLTRPRAADPEALALRAAIDRRRTDRRPYGDEPVPAEARAAITAAVAAEGVRLRIVPPDQMSLLSIAAATASLVQLSDPAYRNELVRWTNRPQWSKDGIPPGLAVRSVPRRVPVRTFALDSQDGLPVGAGGDGGAVYVVLYHADEEPADWLRAGEALSALLLTATAYGLATATISDVVEVGRSRRLVRRVLGEPGQPYIAARCGVAATAQALAEVPRRDAADVIDGPPWSYRRGMDSSA